MRHLTCLLIAVLVSVIAVSCKPPKKDMSLEDFAKIEMEINLPDPELDPERVEDVVDKYGYTYQQFKDFFDKVEKDPKLREKLGEIRLEDRKGQE